LAGRGNAVGQLGFYDLDKRLEAISAKGDRLEALNAIVPFESFRAEIEAVVRLAPEGRKSNAGRKPFDVVMMFKVLMLQALYNLADDHVEYLIRDRLSFMRFLGLGLEDVVPDATTVWLFREALAKAGLVKTLFERFNGYLDAKGYIAPKQRNTREENEAIKAGKTPDGWEEKPARNAQKDKDARWTKKNEQNFYGYKNHVGIDRKHKIIRRYAETDASVHDSQKFDEVLDKSNTSNEVWADSAYRSVETEARLKEKGYKSRVHRRGARNHPLSKRQQAANTTRSRVRARIEHVFGDQENAMGGKFVRTIGIARAAVKIGMMNLV
jgi:transposase, IS5 family